ncbi:MAG: 4-hydroxy-tetrahydrodipicolinate reductase [Thermodesulfobacteriota bacterium]
MKLAVSGAGGRMGKRILALAHEHPHVEIVAAVESPAHPAIGMDAGEYAGIGPIGIPVTSSVLDALDKCDALVEFSIPEVSLDHVEQAAAHGKAIVVGTTGLSDEQANRLRDAGARTRCVVAPNMSMGVNLLFNLVERVALALGSQYDVEIVEAHHKMKKDAPSGTANRLAEIIAEALNRDLGKVGIYGRKGIVGPRTADEIGVLALRGGDIVGEHTVMFVTNGERIELTHRAHSRDAFANGALLAALWLVNQPIGLYDMQDVLGLK